MKSQRRHELEHNVLADWLGKKFKEIQPYVNLILGGVLAVLIVFLGYTWWSRQAAGQTAEAWNEFYKALSEGKPSDFDAVSEKYPGTTVDHFATVIAADERLASGCHQLFVNKASANQELRRAVDGYLAVLESPQPMLRQRATYGLARAYESLGELEKAVEYYEQVTKNWPQGAYTAFAERQLADLQKPSTKKWYDQFAKFDPAPQYTEEPGKRPKFSLDTLKEDAPAEPKLELQEKGPDDKAKQAPAGEAKDTPGGEAKPAPANDAAKEAPTEKK